ncbi:MAG: hypothetical protein NZ578_01120 [Candidatus Binatia bacterium]|nr:hypothetical protein [Candidatus Binatia bacterium]
MEEKAAKATEVQLRFAFLTETTPVPLAHGEPAPTLALESRQRVRRPHAHPPPQTLGEVLTTAHAVLLEAPLADVNAQLLVLLEFCEAALTRALDVVALRPGIPLSDEEYRSVRGIGHAQWLLAEAHGSREAMQEPPRAKRSKRTKSAV